MLSKIKQFITKKLAPLGRLLGKVFTPNALTLLGVLFGILGGAVLGGMIAPSDLGLSWNPILLAVVLILISGIFDGLDGLVARTTNRTSKSGAFLDSVSDRFVDAAVFYGLAEGGYISWEVAFVAFMFTLMVSYSRARGESLGVSAAGIGLMERQERFLYMIVMLLLYYWMGETKVLVWGMLIYITLVAATFFIRFTYIYRGLSKIPSSQ